MDGSRFLRGRAKAFKAFIVMSVILQVFIIPAGRLLASDLPLELRGHGGPIKAISVAPDGKTALTASFDYSLIFWNLADPESTILHRLKGHDAAVNDVAFVPGGEQAVSVSDDGSLAIWNLGDGTLATRIKSPVFKTLDVDVSPDGKLAAVARWDETVRIYDLEKQVELATLKGHRGNVNAVAFSSDSKTLYSAAYDGQILQWDVKTERVIRPLYRHGWGINTITLLDDDRILFGALNGEVGTVSIAYPDKATIIATRDNPIQSVKLSKDGALAAFADTNGTLEVIAAANGSKIESGAVTFGPVWDFDFVPGTNQIFHVGLDDYAVRWQISPRKVSQVRAQFPRRFQVRDSDDPGELEFQRKCSVCHTLTKDGGNRAGPTLYDVFGRRAGTLPGYDYSEALLTADIIWDAETIAELFDDGPDVMVPGTKMPIQRLKKVERRDDLIRFLQKATAPIE